MDRREYVPYCPLCTTSFTASGDICVLSCTHFLCRNCFERLAPQVCPFCQSAGQMRTGDFLGDAVTFLSTWFEEVAIGRNKDEVVDQLIEQILVVRKNLKCKDLPCRIQAEGRICSQVFRCPYDHKLSTFQQQICPIPECPYGDRCFFIHPPPAKPISNPPHVPADQYAAPPEGLPSSKPAAESPPARQSEKEAPSQPASVEQSSTTKSAGKGNAPKKGGTNSSSKKEGNKACCRLL